MWLVFIVVFFSFFSFSQSENWIEGKGKIGFLAAHRSVIGHLATEHAFATEISYCKQARGEKAWHESYNFPTYGVTGFFGSVGNRALLGHYAGAYGFFRIPIVKLKNYSFNWKMGCGLGYGTKIYNPETNILSVAVSTHLNALVSLGVDSRLVFNNHSFTLGLDMTHFSNGATKVPNLGLNIPYISLGYGFRFQNDPIDSVIISHKPFVKKWEYGIMGIGSVKEVFPTEGKKYPVVGLNLVGRRYFKRNVGLEFSFDVISKQAIKAYEDEIEMTQGELLQLGVFAGYLMPLDKFHVIVGMGYYIKDKYKPEDPMYHRVGLRYVFANGININLVLKSHWARADYVEYGIGYTFKK